MPGVTVMGMGIVGSEADEPRTSFVHELERGVLAGERLDDPSLFQPSGDLLQRLL
ncbi:MAG: hypothetical protein ACOX6T_11830 [Myxococcales bacterium]